MSVTFPLKGDLKHMNAQYQHIVIMINRFRESPESMSWFSSKNCSSSLEGVKLKPWLRIICSNVIWSNVHDKNVNTERYLCISDYFHSILIFFIVYEHLNTGRKLEDLKFVLNLYLIKWISKVYPDCSKLKGSGSCWHHSIMQLLQNLTWPSQTSNSDYLLQYCSA